jgi:hypothetical protein
MLLTVLYSRILHNPVFMLFTRFSCVFLSLCYLLSCIPGFCIILYLFYLSLFLFPNDCPIDMSVLFLLPVLVPVTCSCYLLPVSCSCSCYLFLFLLPVPVLVTCYLFLLPVSDYLLPVLVTCFLFLFPVPD